jgi:hypothetical protein
MVCRHQRRLSKVFIADSKVAEGISPVPEPFEQMIYRYLKGSLGNGSLPSHERCNAQKSAAVRLALKLLAVSVKLTAVVVAARSGNALKKETGKRKSRMLSRHKAFSRYE